MNDERKNEFQAQKGELEFAKKYGNIKPKPRLIERESKHFDSADWIMEKNSINTKSPPSKTSNQSQTNSSPDKDPTTSTES